MGFNSVEKADQESILSRINGDKARFNRLRKQKTLQRQRNRELRKTLGLLGPPAAKAGSRVG